MNSNSATDSLSKDHQSESHLTPRSHVPTVPEPESRRAPGRARSRQKPEREKRLTIPAKDRKPVLRITRTRSSDSELACIKTDPEFLRGYEAGAQAVIQNNDVPLFLETYASARRPRYEEGYRLGVSSARGARPLGLRDLLFKDPGGEDGQA